MLILSLGLFLLSRLDASTPIERIAAVLLLTGLGIGLFTSPNSSAVLGAVASATRPNLAASDGAQAATEHYSP